MPQLQAQLQKSLGLGAAELYSETNPDEIALVFDEDSRLPSEFLLQNNLEVVPHVPEVPFIHWSIYRQGIQNLLQQQGHKFSRNQKQLGKFLSQMYKNVLSTAIEKPIFYSWLTKYNPIMH